MPSGTLPTLWQSMETNTARALEDVEIRPPIFDSFDTIPWCNYDVVQNGPTRVTTVVLQNAATSLSSNNMTIMFPQHVSVQLYKVAFVVSNSFQRSQRLSVVSWTGSWPNFGATRTFDDGISPHSHSIVPRRWSLSKGYPSPPSSFQRQFSSSPTFTKASPRRKRQFIPRKAAVELSDRARTFFKDLLKSNPEKYGVILNYQQASSGQPRMVFSFGFVTKDQTSPEDEGYVIANVDSIP